MNIFEKPINKEYVREYLYDLKDDFDGEEWNEDFEELPDVLYQNDSVRISHLSEKNVVECVFLQDDVNVYFAFINIDVSENGLQNALTAISRSDADCAEKFDRICELIFHKKFDRSLEKIDEYGLSLRCSVYSEIAEKDNANAQYERLGNEFAVDVGFHFNNAKVNLCFFSEEIAAIRENHKIAELANRITSYDKKLRDCLNNLYHYL